MRLSDILNPDPVRHLRKSASGIDTLKQFSKLRPCVHLSAKLCFILQIGGVVVFLRVVAFVLVFPLCGAVAFSQQEPLSSGSGFFVNPGGWIVTNAHVVKECTKVTVQGYGEASIEATDALNDLAVLRVKTNKTINPVTFRNKPARLGEDIVVLGYPLAGLLSNSIKITTGNINAIAGIENDTRYLQISAPVQPGNSGGPLVDRSGRVIGINSSTLAQAVSEVIGQTTQNVNFSIRFSLIRGFLLSNGIAFKTDDIETSELKTSEIAEKLASSTVQILCYGQGGALAKVNDRKKNPFTTKYERSRDGVMREARGYDVIGFDYLLLKQVSYKSCMQKCEDDNQCNAITYNKKYSACFLKRDAVILVRNEDAVSAYESSLMDEIIFTNFTVFADRDVTGGDYKRLRGVNFVQCTVECMKEDQCRAYAFVRRKRDCWLKNTVSQIRSKKGVELGLK